MADAFGLDISMPLNPIIGVPYALVVVLGLWWPGRGYIYTAAIIGTGLCLLGFSLSFTGGELKSALINRSFSLLTIWMVALPCLMQKQAQRKKLELQKLIDHIERIYSGEKVPREEGTLYKNILESLLSFTESRYGVIGEVLENEEGRACFQKKAGMAMDFFRDTSAGSPSEEPPVFPESEPYNMEPLFDEVIQSGKPLLMKNVSPAVSNTPLPAGYRPIESFLALPLYHEGRMLGVIGVANRPGGYDGFWADILKPFLFASAGNIHLLRVGREKKEAENALRENRLKLMELEQDAGWMQSSIEEKNARLDELEKALQQVEKTLQDNEDRVRARNDQRNGSDEELDRVKEDLRQVQRELAITRETLRNKEEQVARSERDRNRTAEALWEKEERLMQVMNDFNQLEQDLKKEKETVARIENELNQVQDQLRAKDPVIAEMENRLTETRNELEVKAKQVTEAGEDASRMEKASREKDRRVQEMESKTANLESRLRDYETRLSEVESELSLTKKNLRGREEHLERIGRGIQETLAGKDDGPFPKEPGPMQPREQIFHKREDRSAVEPEKNENDQDRLHELVAHESAQGICGLGLDGGITFINPAGAKMLGYDSSELIGKNQHVMTHHSRIDGTPLPPSQCHICNALAKGVVSHVVDEVFWRKDGSCFPVEYLSTPIVESERRVGAVVTFTDISRRNANETSPESFRIDFDQKAEQPLPGPGKNNGRPEHEFKNGEKIDNGCGHPAREIERSNQDLREFAAIASHDLQEPLRKIIGFGSRLKKDCALSLDERGRDYLDRMEKSAERMQEFIGDLLKYSKAAATPNAYQRVDLKGVVADVLVALESRIEETRATIETGTLPVIEADAMQMHQLFQNLISNALKFHKQGEPPAISIRHRLLENGLHEIRVQDRGIGFDEQYLQRIFKPFERLHGRMEYEGAGMGLAICQKIVHRHKGEITATSSLRKGTTFVITLPARQTREKDLP